jgi:hypothetical protein
MKIAFLVVVLALVSVPVALGAYRTYWYQHNLPGGWSGTDSVWHNHWYNKMYWGPNATWAGSLYFKTPQGAVHYLHSFNGNASFTNPDVYYDAPFCRNDTSSSHFVNNCDTAWG